MINPQLLSLEKTYKEGRHFLKDFVGAAACPRPYEVLFPQREEAIFIYPHYLFIDERVERPYQGRTV
jgi:hypothetical protein